MRENLEYIMRVSTQIEGGYVNNPNDRGGPTNHGITLKTLSAWRGKTATAADVRSLTKNEAISILKKNYFDVVEGDKLPSGLDLSVVDFAINSGPHRAALELQRLLGVAEDGIIGSKTLKVLEKADVEKLIKEYNERRLIYLKSLKGKTGFKTFGRGWTIRVTGSDPKGEWKKVPGIVDMSLALFHKQRAIDVQAKVSPVPTPGGPAAVQPVGFTSQLIQEAIARPDQLTHDLLADTPKQVLDLIEKAGKSTDLDRGFTSTATGTAVFGAAMAAVAAFVTELGPQIADILAWVSGNSEGLMGVLEPMREWSPYIGKAIQLVSVLGALGGMFLVRKRDRKAGARW